MAIPSILRTAAMILTFLAMIPGTPAQSRSFDSARAADSPSGFRTERLTTNQLRIWQRVEKIVKAADEAGQPLHPRLHSLWQRIQSSGHTVFVEMTGRRYPLTTLGGTTTMQEPTPDENRKVIVIWLHLWAIESAFVGPEARRSDGLIPYYRLGKYERYAEALGHELAHAVLMLENPEYARLPLEYGFEAAEIIARKKGGKPMDNEETARRLQRLHSLADKIEQPAQAAELEIWQELVNCQHMGSHTGAGSGTGCVAMLMDLSRAN